MVSEATGVCTANGACLRALARPPEPPTIDPHTGKETDKPELTLIQPDFLAAMAHTMKRGLKNGRKRDDWKKLNWDEKTRSQYLNALLRHSLFDFDPISVACNAMILWYNDKRAEEMRRGNTCDS
jgi:hypothetical protein